MADQKTILVVDDDLELSDGLRVVLEKQGFRVIQARVEGRLGSPVSRGSVEGYLHNRCRGRNPLFERTARGCPGLRARVLSSWRRADESRDRPSCSSQSSLSFRPLYQTFDTVKKPHVIEQAEPKHD